MLPFFTKKSQEEVPGWADFLSAEEYEKFTYEVEKYFTSLDIPFTIKAGMVEVIDNLFGSEKLGLVNVAQLWNREEDEYKATVVPDHFNRMIKAQEFDTEFNKRITDFEFIRSYLGVRVYGHDYIEAVRAENVVYNIIAEELVVLLIFDLPYAIESIKPETIEHWDKTKEELFLIGQANSKQNYELAISQEDIGEFNIWFVESDHLFATNILLDLSNYEELLGSFGALVRVPHRHAIIIYPINSMEIVKAKNSLIPIISGMYQEGPGSISDKLYWFNNDGYISLPYKIVEKKLKFFPPEAFVSMLNNLPE